MPKKKNTSTKKSLKYKKKSKTTKKNKNYCSPKLKSGTASKTCFTKKGLVKIARAWNTKNLKNKINLNKNKSANKLWSEINKKMSKKCSKEYCWVDEVFNKNMGDDPDLDVFKPIVPQKWYNNNREWLNTLDIQNVMFQYEEKYPNFRFIGLNLRLDVLLMNYV